MEHILKLAPFAKGKIEEISYQYDQIWPNFNTLAKF